MKQTIEIEVPDGKKAILKNNTIIFEDIKPQLPKTWDEFCKNYPPKKGECYMGPSCEICSIVYYTDNRNKDSDRNILPSRQAAEAHLALMQLHQLRDCYRQGWKPDLTVPTSMFAIFYMKGKYSVDEFISSSEFLSFQSKEIACKFLFNFRDLIEQAGDLI